MHLETILKMFLLQLLFYLYERVRLSRITRVVIRGFCGFSGAPRRPPNGPVHKSITG
jgi:hypothetical protein